MRISRKIFYPKDHNFGSFYKIFSYEGKERIVGYVSEAEVVPQFIKNDKDQYVPNKYYKIAVRQMKTKKILDDDLAIKTMQERTKLDSYQKETRDHRKQVKRRRLASLEKKLKKSYAGLSFQMPFNRLQCLRITPDKEAYFGVKGTATSFLYPELILDLDVKTSLVRPFRSLLVDLDLSYPIFHFPNRSASFYGVLGAHLQYEPTGVNDLCDGQIPDYGTPIVDFGPQAGLSLLIPLGSQVAVRVDGKLGYQVLHQIMTRNPVIHAFTKGFSISIQYGF